MKKIISSILFVSLLFSMFILDTASFAQTTTEDIHGFVSDAMELISYQPEIEFNTSSYIQDAPPNETDFSSCRLIIKSDNKPEKLNSVGIASGFKDYHIVQFKNENSTESAYEYYSTQSDIQFVYVDKFYKIDDSDVELQTVSKKSIAPTRLNSWGAESIGLYELKDYLICDQTELQEIVVGVIDTGVELGHEFLQGRLIETGFNSSGAGIEGSELDTTQGHGTMVASVIVDSTPDNVKIASYKLSHDGTTTETGATLAVLQAIEDDVDIINTSFGITAKEGLFVDALQYAYDSDIVTVSSAGNESIITEMWQTRPYPSKSPYVITVASTNKKCLPSSFTNFGESVDIAAPGENIPLATLNNSYTVSNGTSFSSPYVAAVCAIIRSLNREYSVSDIKDKVKETAFSFDEMFAMHEMIADLYGTGVVDAIDVLGKRQSDIKVNLEPGDHFRKIVLELSSDNSNEIYYTLDQTVPTKNNGILYTEPIEICNDNVIVKAVAYGNEGLRSEMFSGFYRSWIEEDGKNFTIDESGKILSYTGNSEILCIPESINGTIVKDLSKKLFDDSQVVSVMLPNTITKLSGGFYNCESISYVYGESVVEIGSDAFRRAGVTYVYLPNVERIEMYSFATTSYLNGVDFPKLKSAGMNAFAGSGITYANLPELETAGYAFMHTTLNLIKVNVPKLKYHGENIKGGKTSWFAESFIATNLDLPLVETIGDGDLSSKNYFIKRIEFSNLRNLGDIPISPVGDVNYILVLPSTIETFTANTEITADNVTCTVYGTAGTLTEQWTKENGFKFIEVTPDTAVIQDLPKYYKSYMGELEADVVGFNRTYQWYSNTTDNNTTGKAIEGATSKTFNPTDYPAAAYYYCEVTSKDGDFDPITIKTSACENRSITSDITKVEYVQQEDTHKYFTVTANGRKSMIQFIEPDGGTRTYDRHHKNVSITSYNSNGEVVNELSRDLAYEVWEIYSNMSVGNEIKVRGKVSGKWDIGKYKFKIEPYNPIISMELSSTSGKLGPVPAKVVADDKTEKVMFKMPNGTSVTVASTETDENGNKIFKGNAWMNEDGLNEIEVKFYRNKVWKPVGTLVYTVE